MKLLEFFNKYKVDRVKFCADADIPYPTLMAYLQGRFKPTQKRAEKIEKLSDNLVTVMELRGKDDRIQKREREIDNQASNG